VEPREPPGVPPSCCSDQPRVSKSPDDLALDGILPIAAAATSEAFFGSATLMVVMTVGHYSKWVADLNWMV